MHEEGSSVYVGQECFITKHHDSLVMDYGIDDFFYKKGRRKHHVGEHIFISVTT